MRTFDRNLLLQYLDVGAELKVYVNSEWYSITSKSDLSDQIDGIGYDEWGADHRFAYQAIQQIKVNGQSITLDMLAQKMGDKVDKPDNADNGGESTDDSSKEDDFSLGDDKPDKEKEPDLSWFSPVYDIGRILIQEKERKMKWK